MFLLPVISDPPEGGSLWLVFPGKDHNRGPRRELSVRKVSPAYEKSRRTNVLEIHSPLVKLFYCLLVSPWAASHHSWGIVYESGIDHRSPIIRKAHHTRAIVTRPLCIPSQAGEILANSKVPRIISQRLERAHYHCVQVKIDTPARASDQRIKEGHLCPPARELEETNVHKLNTGHHRRDLVISKANKSERPLQIAVDHVSQSFDIGQRILVSCPYTGDCQRCHFRPL